MAQGQNQVEEQLAELSSDANAALHAGRFAEAEKQYRDLIQLQRRALGPEHERTLLSRINQAIALDKLGRYAEEDAILREVLQVQQQDPRFGMEHSSTLGTVMMLGYCLLKQSRFKEAEPMLRSVHALEVRVRGPRHHETLEIQMTLGNCLYEQNQLEEAERLLRDGLEGFQAMEEDTRVPVYKASMVGGGMRDLACCLSKAGKHTEAESLLRAAVKYTRHCLGEANRLTIDCMGWHASALSAMGKHAAAEVMYKLAVQGYRAVYGWESSEAEDVASQYVTCLLVQQKLAPAEAFMRDTLSHLQQAFEEDDRSVLKWMRLLAQFLQAQGQATTRNEAKALLRRARELAHNRQG